MCVKVYWLFCTKQWAVSVKCTMHKRIRKKIKRWICSIKWKQQKTKWYKSRDCFQLRSESSNSYTHTDRAREREKERGSITWCYATKGKMSRNGMKSTLLYTKHVRCSIWFNAFWSEMKMCSMQQALPHHHLCA